MPNSKPQDTPSMGLFILKTPNGRDPENIEGDFSVFSSRQVPITFIEYPEKESGLKKALPLTKIGEDALKQKTLTNEKIQHVIVAEKIKRENLKGGWVVLDTVRFTDPLFAFHTSEHRLPDADISIFAPSNFNMTGTFIHGTSWVKLESEDPSRNTVVSAYYISKVGASKLVGLRNEFLNNGRNLAQSLQQYYTLFGNDRIVTYASFLPMVTKPLYTK